MEMEAPIDGLLSFNCFKELNINKPVFFCISKVIKVSWDHLGMK